MKNMADDFSYTVAVRNLCGRIEFTGRKFNPEAVIRLLRYWSVRTPLAESDIAKILEWDVTRGLKISMKQHGWT